MSLQSKSKPKNNKQAALSALRRKLPGRVFVDDESRFAASIDNLRLSFLPDAVVRVQAASEVGEALKLAHRHEIPITARGAGSSATGAAAAAAKRPAAFSTPEKSAASEMKKIYGKTTRPNSTVMSKRS